MLVLKGKLDKSPRKLKAILPPQKEGDNVVYPYLWRMRIKFKGDLKVDEK